MTTEQELIDMIHNTQLTINNINLCSHSKDYCYYFTDELCCEDNQYLDCLDYLDFSWTRRRGCKECFDGSIGILECGGHYETLIAFHNGEIMPEDIEKDKLFRVQSPDERLQEYILGYMEDMEVIELLKLIKCINKIRKDQQQDK